MLDITAVDATQIGEQTTNVDLCDGKLTAYCLPVGIDCLVWSDSFEIVGEMLAVARVTQTGEQTTTVELYDGWLIAH